jgi:hypothetical protein
MGTPNFVGKIVSLFTKSRPADPNPARSNTTETSPGDISTNSLMNTSLWQTSAERKAIFDDIENMDANDEIVSQALDTLAEVATGMDEDSIDGFILNSTNDQVLQILNDLVKRLNLKREAADIIRKMAKHGNEFREVIIGQDITGQLKILKLKKDLPAWQFNPNLDEYSNQNADYPWVQNVGPMLAMPPIKFKPWQLVQWRCGEVRKELATPFLKSARRNWKRLQFQEDTMALARAERAYSKLIHRVPVHERDTADKHDACIQKYKQTMEKKLFNNWALNTRGELQNPHTVSTDFYIPDDGSGRGGIDVVDPKNNNLQNIDDVIYAQSRLISRLGVPRKYLNIEGAKTSSLNQADGGKEDKHFARKIRGLQMAFIEGLNFIFALELILHRINPGDTANMFTIFMPSFNTEDDYNKAQAENTLADALTKVSKVLDLPTELITTKYLRLNEYEKRQFAPEIKIRTEPNPALQTTNPNPFGEGGAPAGQRPGSSTTKKRTESALLGDLIANG